MELLIISGSQREKSQSAKVATYLSELTDLTSQFTQSEHIELCKQSLPFWDGNDDTKFDLPSNWGEISQKLTNADALILITPEWSSTASPLLKNLLMMCEASETGHKPVLIISVVSGISGAYPIAELRMNAFGNNKLVAIPDHLIIRNVESVLNTFNEAKTQKSLLPDYNIAEADISEPDQHIRHRIGYSLHTLTHYATVLKKLRRSLSEHTYPDERLYDYSM